MVPASAASFPHLAARQCPTKQRNLLKIDNEQQEQRGRESQAQVYIEETPVWKMKIYAQRSPNTAPDTNRDDTKLNPIKPKSSTKNYEFEAQEETMPLAFPELVPCRALAPLILFTALTSSFYPLCPDRIL